MITFLPFPDFEKSAACLDVKRLGKQRLEVLDILRALDGKNLRWQNHPAVKMWRGWEHILVDYGLAICNEWTKRGYQDNCATKIVEFAYYVPKGGIPYWLGLEKFHESHQSQLYQKDSMYYFQFEKAGLKKLPYFWPEGLKND